MIHKGRLPPPVASRAPDDGHGMCALIIAIHSHCFLVCPRVVSRVRAFGYEVSRVNTGESDALAQDSCFSTERWELEQSPRSALRPRVGWPKMSRPQIFTHLLVQCSRILSTYVLDFTQNVAGICKGGAIASSIPPLVHATVLRQKKQPRRSPIRSPQEIGI